MHKQLEDQYCADKDVVFMFIQTVFEGHDTNTADAALDSIDRHDLSDIALGHDTGPPPTVMVDYQTGHPLDRHHRPRP